MKYELLMNIHESSRFRFLLHILIISSYLTVDQHTCLQSSLFEFCLLDFPLPDRSQIRRETFSRMVYKNFEDSDVLCSENLLFPNLKFADSLYLSYAYSFRYWVIRTLTCHTPFLPPWLTRRKSVLELLFICAAFIILIFTSLKILTSKTSGQLTQNFAVVMICTAFRNNVFTYAFGIPYERAIEWHKMAGILTLTLAACHVYHNRAYIRKEKSGLILYGLFIFTSSMYLLKKAKIEIFYYMHVSLYLAIIVLGYIHGAKVLVASVILWVCDIAIRYYFRARQVEAEFTSHPNGIMQISFKKPFHYSAGQFCFIAVPALSVLQFHVSG